MVFYPMDSFKNENPVRQFRVRQTKTNHGMAVWKYKREFKVQNKSK